MHKHSSTMTEVLLYLKKFSLSQIVVLENFLILNSFSFKSIEIME
jgi:hypothetical protein